MPGPYNTHTTGDEIVQDHKEEIRGKVILTTGVSPGGLGAVFVERVAAGAQPKLLILASRNVLKMKATADAISKLNSSVKTRTLQIDFESFKSVREAATTVNGWSDVPSIDILMNNAGIMAVDYAKTEDGIERHFKSNHLGPFLFTNLIIDKILASDSPRIINVSSSGHRLSAIRWADIGFSVSLYALAHYKIGPRKPLINFRKASYTIGGVPTARRRRQISSQLSHSRRNLETRASRPCLSIPVL